RHKQSRNPRGLQLLAQAKAFNNLVIPIRVSPVEIVQQTTPLIDHHDQAPARCMVLDVRLQIVDPLAEKCNLHLWRSRILDMCPELLNQHNFGVAQVPPTRRPLKFPLFFDSSKLAQECWKCKATVTVGCGAWLAQLRRTDSHDRVGGEEWS